MKHLVGVTRFAKFDNENEEIKTPLLLSFPPPQTLQYMPISFSSLQFVCLLLDNTYSILFIFCCACFRFKIFSCSYFFSSRGFYSCRPGRLSSNLDPTIYPPFPSYLELGQRFLCPVAAFIYFSSKHHDFKIWTRKPWEHYFTNKRELIRVSSR